MWSNNELSIPPSLVAYLNIHWKVNNNKSCANHLLFCSFRWLASNKLCFTFYSQPLPDTIFKQSFATQSPSIPIPTHFRLRCSPKNWTMSVWIYYIFIVIGDCVSYRTHHLLRLRRNELGMASRITAITTQFLFSFTVKSDKINSTLQPLFLASRLIPFKIFHALNFIRRFPMVLFFFFSSEGLS